MKLPYKVVKGFGLCMRPWELNIKHSIKGNNIYLYDRETTDPVHISQKKYSFEILMYYFARYKKQFSPVFSLKNYYEMIKTKLK